MTTLRIMQAFLILFALFGFWRASRLSYDIEMTKKAVAIFTFSVLTILLSQFLPIVWLSLAGTDAIAKVTGIECKQGEKHYVRFEFEAENRKISGVDSDTYGIVRCDSLRVGDNGSVVYIHSTPQVYAWGSIRNHLGEDLVMCFLAAIVVPFISYAGIRKRLQTRA